MKIILSQSQNDTKFKSNMPTKIGPVLDSDLILNLQYPRIRIWETRRSILDLALTYENGYGSKSIWTRSIRPVAFPKRVVDCNGELVFGEIVGFLVISSTLVKIIMNDY